MPKRAVRYPKELSRPMLPIQFECKGLIDQRSDDEIKAINRRRLEENTEEILRRMDLLRDHYGAGSWLELAYALASQVVPGLTIAKGRPGAPRKADMYLDAKLKFEVIKEREQNPRLSVGQALARIAKRPGEWHGKKNLRTMYYRANNAFVEMINDAEAYRALVRAQKGRGK